jgi:hypothetical protein
MDDDRAPWNDGAISFSESTTKCGQGRKIRSTSMVILAPKSHEDMSLAECVS